MGTVDYFSKLELVGNIFWWRSAGLGATSLWFRSMFSLVFGVVVGCLVMIGAALEEGDARVAVGELNGLSLFIFAKFVRSEYLHFLMEFLWSPGPCIFAPKPVISGALHQNTTGSHCELLIEPSCSHAW